MYNPVWYQARTQADLPTPQGVIAKGAFVKFTPSAQDDRFIIFDGGMCFRTLSNSEAETLLGINPRRRSSWKRDAASWHTDQGYMTAHMEYQAARAEEEA